MLKTQKPKYDANAEGRLVNRTTGQAIPDDEPVFVLRAKDVHAVPALQAYLRFCRHSDHRTVIKSRIQDFLTFATQNEQRMKEPDSSMQDLAGANVGRGPFAVDPAVAGRNG